jgi:putative hydrolase of the HAD superfamily
MIVWPTLYLEVNPRVVCMIKLVIFDAGGVLYAGNREVVVKAVEGFLEKHGVHDYAESDRVWSRIEKPLSVGKMDLRQAYEKWLKGVGLHKDLIDEWLEVDKKEIWSKFRITPGINRLLAKLKKNYILAVLSDTIATKSKKIEEMEIVGVNHRIFSEVFTSHDLGLCKPNKKAFHAVLERFNVKPSEAVFVGDACDELSGARKLGLVTIGFGCMGGDFRIKRLDEIQDILRELNDDTLGT